MNLIYYVKLGEMLNNLLIILEKEVVISDNILCKPRVDKDTNLLLPLDN